MCVISVLSLGVLSLAELTLCGGQDDDDYDDHVAEDAIAKRGTTPMKESYQRLPCVCARDGNAGKRVVEGVRIHHS